MTYQREKNFSDTLDSVVGFLSDGDVWSTNALRYRVSQHLAVSHLNSDIEEVCGYLEEKGSVEHSVDGSWDCWRLL